MDATRTWLIRLGTVTGFGVLALAVYNVLRTHQIECGPYRGACDLPPPTHPHLQLAPHELIVIGPANTFSAVVRPV